MCTDCDFPCCHPVDQAWKRVSPGFDSTKAAYEWLAEHPAEPVPERVIVNEIEVS